MVVFGLGKDFLFKSILGRCDLEYCGGFFIDVLMKLLLVLPTL